MPAVASLGDDDDDDDAGGSQGDDDDNLSEDGGSVQQSDNESQHRSELDVDFEPSSEEEQKSMSPRSTRVPEEYPGEP